MKRDDNTSLKNVNSGERRGLSRITVVLIIISIIIVGMIVYNIFKKTSEDTTDTANNSNLSILKVVLVKNETVQVVVQRNSEEGDLVGVYFNISDGNNFTIVRANTTMQKKDNETFTFNLRELNLSTVLSVSITPICLVETEDGKFIEVIGDFTSSTAVSSEDKGIGGGGGGHVFICGDGILNFPNDYGIYEECDDGNYISGDGCSATCIVEGAASLNGVPSSLTLTVISDTEIQLNWTSTSTNEDGFSIEKSTDNITYSEINTTAVGVSAYSDTGLIADTTYYYKVRAFKGSKYSEYSNVDSDNTGITFDKGKVVFTFDSHGAETIYTHGFPLFVSKGIAVTMYLQTGSVQAGVWDYQKEMINAGVLDLQSHSNTHTSYDELSEAEIIAEEAAVDAAFIAEGLPVPEHFAYPSGVYDFATKEVMKSLRKDTAAVDAEPFDKTTTFKYPTFRDYDKFSIRRTSIDNIGQASYLYGGVNGMAFMKAYMDQVALSKGAIIFYAHYITTDPSSPNYINVDDLEELIDYAQSIDVDIITISQLYDLMFEGTTVNAETDDFVLTSTGDGTGVSKISLLTMQDITLTLNGTAKFYTDAAGTLGESSTWEMPMGYRTIYIRCPSGISNLKIPKNRITQLYEWVSSTNAASLGGNISQMTLLDRIYLLGNNNISGDISGLTDLTYLYLRGNNTISGDIFNLTKLTYINADGGNSNLSGSIAGLTNLNYLYVLDSNTLSGSIAGLTNLTYLFVTGDNTLTGSIAGLTNLTYLFVTGDNTLTGSIDLLTSLTRLYVLGNNTISGDLKAISAKLTSVKLNPSRIDTYTSGGNWSKLLAESEVYLIPSVGYGLSSAEVDLLINEIEATRVADRPLHIRCTGSCQARTSASDAAEAAIIADGGTVTTNPPVL